MRLPTDTQRPVSDQDQVKIPKKELVERHSIPADWPEGMRYYTEGQW